jgi:hypothetical protein
MINGSSNRRLSILLMAARIWLARKFDVHLAYATPFHRDRKASKGQVWAALGTHLSEPASAAIIRIMEPYDHWTVVASVRKKRLVLCDSEQMKWLDHKYWGTDPHARPPYPHLIKATGLFLIHCPEPVRV